MNWFEEALAEKERIAQYEYEQPFRLTINTENDIPADCSRITHVHFSSQYEGPSPTTILPRIIQQAYDLKSLSIFVPVQWSEICNLDLSGVQRLKFCLDGIPEETVIVAGALKELCVIARITLTPMELLMRPFPHIDFSDMPHLESLELKNIQQIYTDDFMHLAELKRLSITGSDLTDLAWLSKAAYELEFLFIDGNIIDCSGIESQRHLQSLILFHTSFRDVKPIERLSGLQLLDLRGNEIQDEGRLRCMGIPSVLMTKKDGSRHMIELDVRRILGNAVRRVVSQEKHVNDAPKVLRRYILKNIERPFHDRVREAIEAEYATEMERFVQPGCAKHTWLSDTEYIETYRRYAIEYYPFLEG